MAVVDVYDALTSQRAYRDALSHVQAMNILREETEQGKFDANLLKELEILIGSRSDLQTSSGEA